MIWVLVQMALSLGTGTGSADALVTPEGVLVTAPRGSQFREVKLGTHGPAYVAHGREWAAGVFVALVADAPAATQRALGSAATRRSTRGADRWDLSAMKNLRGTGGTRAHALAYGAGAVASGNDPISIVVVAADERMVTVVASARDPDLAHRVADEVADSVAFKSLARDPHLVGCYIARSGESRMCFRASGTFASCAPGEAECVADLCRQPDDGRWFTAKGILSLQFVTERTRSGPYSLARTLKFDGKRWDRVDACAERG